MFKNILLGVDGSAHALKAARLAGNMARVMKANLRVVAAFDPVPSYLGDSSLEEAIAARVQAAEAILKEALEAVGDMPAPVATEILEGPAAEAILSVAQTHSSDLIIVGSRGHGQLASLLLGSQSNKIIQHAHCPVLVVR